MLSCSTSTLAAADRREHAAAPIGAGVGPRLERDPAPPLPRPPARRRARPRAARRGPRPRSGRSGRSRPPPRARRGSPRAPGSSRPAAAGRGRPTTRTPEQLFGRLHVEGDLQLPVPRASVLPAGSFGALVVDHHGLSVGADVDAVDAPAQLHAPAQLEGGQLARLAVLLVVCEGPEGELEMLRGERALLLGGVLQIALEVGAQRAPDRRRALGARRTGDDGAQPPRAPAAAGSRARSSVAGVTRVLARLAPSRAKVSLSASWREAAAGERLGVRLEASRCEQSLDEPGDRTADPALERRRRPDALAQARRGRARRVSRLRRAASALGADRRDVESAERPARAPL